MQRRQPGSWLMQLKQQDSGGPQAANQPASRPGLQQQLLASSNQTSARHVGTAGTAIAAHMGPGSMHGPNTSSGSPTEVQQTAGLAGPSVGTHVGAGILHGPHFLSGSQGRTVMHPAGLEGSAETQLGNLVGAFSAHGHQAPRAVASRTARQAATGSMRSESPAGGGHADGRHDLDELAVESIRKDIGAAAHSPPSKAQSRLKHSRFAVPAGLRRPAGETSSWHSSSQHLDGHSQDVPPASAPATNAISSQRPKLAGTTSSTALKPHVSMTAPDAGRGGEARDGLWRPRDGFKIPGRGPSHLGSGTKPSMSFEEWEASMGSGRDRPLPTPHQAAVVAPTAPHDAASTQKATPAATQLDASPEGAAESSLKPHLGTQAAIPATEGPHAINETGHLDAQSKTSNQGGQPYFFDSCSVTCCLAGHHDSRGPIQCIASMVTLSRLASLETTVRPEPKHPET